MKILGATFLGLMAMWLVGVAFFEVTERITGSEKKAEAAGWVGMVSTGAGALALAVAHA